MRDDERRSSLEEFGERLRSARAHGTPHQPPEPQSRQFGVAYRVLVEMVAGVVVGGILGWLLDYWLGTRPWLLVATIVLGFAAGMSNAYRTTRRIAAEAERRARRDEAGPTGEG